MKRSIMNNIKFQTLGIIKDYFNNLNQQKGRRALIRALGDGNQAIAAADILIYLVWQTFDTDEELLKKYDGYIVRTNEQIVLATGCSDFNNSSRHIEMLIEKGFIERDRKTFRNKCRYKVNLNTVIYELDRCLEELDLEVKEYTSKQESIKKADEERSKNPNRSKVDWESVNSLADNPSEENLEILEGQGLSALDVQLIYYVDKFYKEATGYDFYWTLPAFNTLTEVVNGRGTKIMTDEDINRLRYAIQTLDEVSWMKKAHISTRICKRLAGYKRF